MTDKSLANAANAPSFTPGVRWLGNYSARTCTQHLNGHSSPGSSSLKLAANADVVRLFPADECTISGSVTILVSRAPPPLTFKRAARCFSGQDLPSLDITPIAIE